jgi:Zn-dependent peptidase ImmA (M78 family)/DNA-binding XRE family transcriptional regulator
MNTLESINPQEVGERLRNAREASRLTQKDAADKVGFARTTLVSIEKGERRLRMSEAQKLAELYRTSINALLRAEAIHVDISPRFRKLEGAKDAAVVSAAELLNNLAKAEVELENLLGIVRSKVYVPERPIMPGDVRAQAEQDAQELRQYLGLGNSPISDIVMLLEMDLNIRVYVRKIEGSISGLFVYDDALGPCILVNANHRRDRRTQTAANECAHFISARREAEVLLEDESFISREERYANAFGRAFLTPARAVMQKHREIRAGADTLTRRHIITLSHYFRVSREAMVRRLEELGLVKKGAWEWFTANGGITDAHARQVLGDLDVVDSERISAQSPTTLRLSMLASEAHRRGLLSEGQLARLLCISRVELRGILEISDAEGNEVHGAPKFLE